MSNWTVRLLENYNLGEVWGGGGDWRKELEIESLSNINDNWGLQSHWALRDNPILQTDEWVTNPQCGFYWAIWAGVLDSWVSIKPFLTSSQDCYFLFFVSQYKLPFPRLFILAEPSFITFCLKYFLIFINWYISGPSWPCWSDFWL